MNRLREKYQKKIIPKLKKELGLGNDLEVPEIEKITLNVGASKALEDSSMLEVFEDTLKRISGQKPIQTKAKKAISGFGIRGGQTVGLKVVMRSDRMYAFLDKFVNVALPRVRDFRGVPYSAVDDRGNITVGIKEHTAFPEINPDEVEKLHGLEVVITIRAEKRDHAIKLLELFGFPFTKEEVKKAKPARGGSASGGKAEQNKKK